jgi:hypothetical protein
LLSVRDFRGDRVENVDSLIGYIDAAGVVFWILGIVATTPGETGGDLPVVLRAPPVTPLPRNARGSLPAEKSSPSHLSANSERISASSQLGCGKNGGGTDNCGARCGVKRIEVREITVDLGVSVS